MAATINASFISQFSDAIHSLVEQKSSKLRGTVRVETANGEKHFFERLGSFSAEEVTGRMQDTSLQDPAHTRRMATVRKYHSGTYLDDIDKMKLLIDPTSEYTMKLARAHARNLDAVILAAILGSAATGADGSGSQAFDTSNNQIAHGSAGFTLAKFNQAMRVLENGDVDIDATPLFCVLGPRAKEDLFAEVGIISVDYQTGKALASGQLPNLRGVTLVTSTRVPDETSGSVFRALLYTGDTAKLAVARDLQVKTAERADKNFAAQVSTYMSMGAVRMEEATVVDVLYQ
jgi:hypothetical protein